MLFVNNHTRQSTALHRPQNHCSATQQQMLITQNSENKYTKTFTAHYWLCSSKCLKKRLVNKWKVILFAHKVILLYLLPLSIVPANACKSTEHVFCLLFFCQPPKLWLLAVAKMESINIPAALCIFYWHLVSLKFLIYISFSVVETNNHHLSRSEDPREMFSQLSVVAFLSIKSEVI